MTDTARQGAIAPKGWAAEEVGRPPKPAACDHAQSRPTANNIPADLWHTPLPRDSGAAWPGTDELSSPGVARWHDPPVPLAVPCTDRFTSTTPRKRLGLAFEHDFCSLLQVCDTWKSRSALLVATLRITCACINENIYQLWLEKSAVLSGRRTSKNTPTSF